jgi:hypothetical protein
MRVALLDVRRDDDAMNTKHVYEMTTARPEDGRYKLVVERTSHPYVGILKIIDLNREWWRRGLRIEGKTVVTEKVNLSYDARFGPDVQDVADWTARFDKFLDEERRHVRSDRR